MLKKISICIATYNGEKYIKEQILSILSQIKEIDEIIISDDSSSDSTLSIIQNLDDPRIKLYKNNNFHSPIYNFENAIKKATGDIIILADQDDVWMENKVEVITHNLKDNLLVFSNALIVDEDLRNASLLYTSTNNTGFIKNLIKNRYVGATMAFKKELLKMILPFPHNIPMHDQWIALMAELHGKTKYISTPLIYYRRHSTNASETGKKSKNSIYKKFLYRLNIMFALWKRILLQK